MSTNYENNRNHCKAIAEEIELFTNGNGYKCPHCEQVHSFDDYEQSEHENENGNVCYTCPNCGGDVDESELEAVSIYDYFERTEIYDIEYRIGSDKEYRSVALMVACGGPNIFIDTKSKLVHLHWWTEYAEYPLDYDAVDEIDNYFTDLFNC